MIPLLLLILISSLHQHESVAESSHISKIHHASTKEQNGKFKESYASFSSLGLCGTSDGALQLNALSLPVQWQAFFTSIL